MFYVYILQSLKDNTFYIGQTNNIKGRIKRHNSGNVKSTANRHPYELVYFETYKLRSESMFREWEIKKKYNTERRKKLVLSFDKNLLKQFQD
jgi:putative endonuclease